MCCDDRTEDAAAFQVTEVICGSSFFESRLARHVNARPLTDEQQSASTHGKLLFEPLSAISPQPLVDQQTPETHLVT